MKKIIRIEAGSYYMIESKATARNCYFESDIEANQFRILFKRYLGGFVEIHKMYVSSEGYQILIKVRSKRVLRKYYLRKCEKKGVEIKQAFWDEPWRIVSEQMRIFHSVYAKWTNGIRDRQGGLVQERYGRYYFGSKEEFDAYIKEKEEGGEIKGQRNIRYRVDGKWKEGVKWGVFRGVAWVEAFMDKGFKNYVVEKLINNTLISHSLQNKP